MKNILVALLPALFCLGCSKGDHFLYKDAMNLGVKLDAPTLEYEKYEDDLIHPCVRYIEGGFAGHEWWMVGTPFKNYDESKENPILYYGDSREDGTPPLSWTPVAVIADTPLKGYNSDPSLFFEDSKLWIFWRESQTPDCLDNNYERATFGCYTEDGKNFSSKKIFAGEVSDNKDSEVCPIIVKWNNRIMLYGTNYLFQPKRKSKGLSIWYMDGNSLDKDRIFTKIKDVSIKTPKALKFWHFDLFTYNNIYYCVATSENARSIFLGKSSDAENFVFWSTPLLTKKETGRSYFYKPSALVKDGIFYLWHPVLEEDTSSKTSRIWMSQIPFSDLIKILEDNEN